MTAPLIDLAAAQQGRRIRLLTLENQQLRTQLAAVIDTVATESALTYSLNADMPPSDEQIAAESERVRRHLMRVALQATHHGIKPTGGAS